MSFILDARRQSGVVAAFGRYRSYIASLRGKMPPSAFDLASSDWYFDFGDHRCPHDAWLEQITIGESASGERGEIRTTSIRIRLLGAYHDGFFEFHYPRVIRYRLDMIDAEEGHQDWRYDEFRLSEDGHVIHEIEWSGAGDAARWVIVASDVEYKWHPLKQGG